MSPEQNPNFDLPSVALTNILLHKSDMKPLSHHNTNRIFNLKQLCDSGTVQQLLQSFLHVLSGSNILKIAITKFIGFLDRSRYGGRESGTEGERQGGRERGREGRREGGREGGRVVSCLHAGDKNCT